MGLWIVAVVLGLAGLVWSSDRFVYGASALASNLGLPPLLIGLVVVGVGTSAPEMVVSALASAAGTPGIAIGNVVGSNIANIGLVVGLTAVIAPIAVASRTLRQEFPLMFAVVALAWFLMHDASLGRTGGVVLLGAFAATLATMAWLARGAQAGDPLGTEFEAEIPRQVGRAAALGWTLLGLLALLASSQAVVWGAVGIAEALEVSDLVIGLTVVAIGTSLPELGVSIASVLKREPDIAVGNIIGSNIFNLLLVLAMPALIAPGAVPEAVVTRDLPVMTAFCVALLLTAYGFRGPGRVQRWEGALLLAGFLAYQVLLYLDESGAGPR